MRISNHVRRGPIDLANKLGVGRLAVLNAIGAGIAYTLATLFPERVRAIAHSHWRISCAVNSIGKPLQQSLMPRCTLALIKMAACNG